MGFQTRPTSRNFSQEEAEDNIARHLISTLRSAFLTSDFDQVEEKLIARETTLKKEIIKLKSENEMREEKHQFDRLEKLNLEEEQNAANERYEKPLEEVMRGVGSDDKVTRWENNISRLEKDTEELVNERRMGSRKMRGRRGNSGMIFYDRKDNCCLTRSPVIDLENVVELNENGSVAASAQVSPLSVHSHSKGNGHQQNSDVITMEDGKLELDESLATSISISGLMGHNQVWRGFITYSIGYVQITIRLAMELRGIANFKFKDFYNVVEDLTACVKLDKDNKCLHILEKFQDKNISKRGSERNWRKSDRTAVVAFAARKIYAQYAREGNEPSIKYSITWT